MAEARSPHGPQVDKTPEHRGVVWEFTLSSILQGCKLVNHKSTDDLAGSLYTFSACVIRLVLATTMIDVVAFPASTHVVLAVSRTLNTMQLGTSLYINQPAAAATWNSTSMRVVDRERLLGLSDPCDVSSPKSGASLFAPADLAFGVVSSSSRPS